MLRPTLRHQSPFYFVYGDFTLFVMLFQYISTIIRFCNSIRCLGCSAFNRLYLRNRFCFLFLQVLGCFGSLGVAPIWLCIHHMVLELHSSGLPHSEIRGSLLTYSSPRRIAVRCVLLRLLVPRHPPCTLNFLTLQFFCYFATSTIQFSKIY